MRGSVIIQGRIAQDILEQAHRLCIVTELDRLVGRGLRGRDPLRLLPGMAEMVSDLS